jgi:hypothetical protein
LHNKTKCRNLTERWLSEHPGKYKEYAKRCRNKHSEKYKAMSLRWRKNNPDRVKAIQHRCRIKRLKNPKCVLDDRMGGLVWQSLRKGKNSRSWKALVGYTTEDLKRHLESLFTEGMTWDIFISGKIHIDHIMPVSRFHYKTAEDPEFRICWDWLIFSHFGHVTTA